MSREWASAFGGGKGADKNELGYDEALVRLPFHQDFSVGMTGLEPATPHDFPPLWQMRQRRRDAQCAKKCPHSFPAHQRNRKGPELR